LTKSSDYLAASSASIFDFVGYYYRVLLDD